MSDSEDSTLTYMAVSSPFEGLSDIGSPGVNGPPVMPEDLYAYVAAAFQAPTSLDYVPGSKGPEQEPLSPEFVLEPVYPKFMPPEDEGWRRDPKEDPIDYPAGRGDDDDDDDESSDDDGDNDDDVDEEEEEHPALADSVPPPVHQIARLLAIPSPPPSPISLWLSPLPQIPSPPLPVSPPLTVSPPLPISPPPLPASPTYPLGFRAAMIRAVAPSTYILLSRSETPPLGTPSLLPISLPTSSSPLLLPSIDRRANKPEVCLPPRKRLCIDLGLRYEVGESSSAPTTRPTRGFRADYSFVAT
ncbi:hypothetical protein Tco_1086594, partial [Tanacetum coccineum]